MAFKNIAHLCNMKIKAKNPPQKHTLLQSMQIETVASAFQNF